MELNDILANAVRVSASDIHLKNGRPPTFRIYGELFAMEDACSQTSAEVSRLALSIMTERQRVRFHENNEIDLAYGVAGLGRFRVNVFQQRGTVGAVFRAIPLTVPSIEDLALPPVVAEIAMEARGLVLVTGSTGSGKSTSLASMIDHINTHRAAHILTIEDPVEFLVQDKRSMVNQREIGSDTLDFPAALRSAVRQDPDVILVGEMRDFETIGIALTAAETGHLVMSTLHTLDATETISRIVSAFPPHQQRTIRLRLGTVLKAVISQRLVPQADERGLVPAVEILRNTARVRELIEDKERTKELRATIGQGHTTYGMQTFDQSLMKLFQRGVISYPEALRQATNADDFALRASGVASTSDSIWDDFDVNSKTATSMEARDSARSADRNPLSDPKGYPGRSRRQ